MALLQRLLKNLKILSSLSLRQPHPEQNTRDPRLLSKNLTLSLLEISPLLLASVVTNRTKVVKEEVREKQNRLNTLSKLQRGLSPPEFKLINARFQFKNKNQVKSFLDSQAWLLLL